MSVRMIYGPAGSGKTSEAMSTFLEAASRGDNPVFIAPSAPDVRHFQRELIRRAGLLVGGRVSTFDNLCSDILDEVRSGLKVIDGSERKLLLRAVVDETENLTFLRASSGSDGFIESLARLIGELEGACVAPKQLAAAAVGILPQELNTDLFRIYENYRIALSDQEVTDKELAQCQAIEFLLEDPALLVHRSVIIDGFWDFTALQRSLISALEQAAASMLITAPFDDDNPAQQIVKFNFEGLVEKFRGEKLPAPGDSTRPPALVHLDRHLFGEVGASIPGRGSLVILKGAGERGEAEMVASEVLNQWRSGVSLDQMAVVCRSLNREAFAIADALAEFGIPFELNARLPLAGTPLGQTCLFLMDFIATAVAPEDDERGMDARHADSQRALLGYLRSPLPVASDSRVDAFSRQVRLHGIQGFQALLDAWASQGGRDLYEIEAIRAAAAEGMNSLGKALISLAGRLVSNAIRDDAAGGLGGSESSEQDLVALRIFSQVCTEAASIDSQALKGVDALKLLRRGILSASVSPSTGRLRNCVRILDPHRVLNQRFDQVFICGMLEGRFPTLGGAEPFISDTARKALREKGLDLRAVTDRLEDERFLFHRALSRARRKVFLSYPYCNSEGQENVSSLFVDEVRELVEIGPDDVRERKLSEIAFQSREAPTRNQALLSLSLKAGELRTADGELPAQAEKRLTEAAGPAGLEDDLESCLKAAQSVKPTLTDDKVRSIFQAIEDFSATRLERYGSCKFRYLIEYHMLPAAMDVDTYFLDRGIIAHDVLARFIRETKSHVTICKADEEQKAALHHKMAQIIEEEMQRYGVGHDTEGELLRFTLKSNLDRFIDREASCTPSLIPIDVEVRFGHGSQGIGEVNLGEGLTVSGRIDRIDCETGRDRALVIDYKTSSDISTWKHYEDKMVVQVPLYILAAKGCGYSPIGGEYYSLTGDARRGFYLEEFQSDLGRKINRNDLVSSEVLEEIVEDARERALSLAKGIRAMDFSVDPLPGECDRCDYAIVCRGARRANRGGR